MTLGRRKSPTSDMPCVRCAQRPLTMREGARALCLAPSGIGCVMGGFETRLYVASPFACAKGTGIPYVVASLPRVLFASRRVGGN